MSNDYPPATMPAKNPHKGPSLLFRTISATLYGRLGEPKLVQGTIVARWELEELFIYIVKLKNKIVKPPLELASIDQENVVFAVNYQEIDVKFQGVFELQRLRLRKVKTLTRSFKEICKPKFEVLGTEGYWHRINRCAHMLEEEMKFK